MCTYIAAQTTALLLALPVICPHLFRSEAALEGEMGALLRLGWPLVRIVRYAHRSHLMVTDIDKVRKLGAECLLALHTAMPSELCGKPKWHYTFAHLHEMLERFVCVLLISRLRIVYMCVGRCVNCLLCL